MYGSNSVLTRVIVHEGFSTIVGYQVLTAVVMNVAIFWDVVPFNAYVNRHFRGKYYLCLQGRQSAK
jgi:hypothetical protein